MTTQVLINRFLNRLRRDGKSVLTLSAYATDLKQFSSFLSSSSFSSLSLAGLKTICQQWTERLTPNTAARKLTTLRSFLGWGYRGGYIKKDFAATVSRPKRKTFVSAKPLSQSQIARLRRAATVQERLLLELLVSTGMRLAESLAIKMKNLRGLNSDYQTSDSRQSDSRIVRLSEVRLSGRRYPISEMLRQSLEYYLAAETRGPRNYLLVSPKTGRPPGVRAAGMILSKLGKRAGVRGVTPRNLRATFKMWAR